MDIRVERNQQSENKFVERIQNYFAKHLDKYSFIQSIDVFFRGQKHKSKKVKLHAKLKGKDIFAKGSGLEHEIALDVATQRLLAQIEKYKTKRFKKAS